VKAELGLKCNDVGGYIKFLVMSDFGSITPTILLEFATFLRFTANKSGPFFIKSSAYTTKRRQQQHEAFIMINFSGSFLLSTVLHSV